MAVGVWCAAGDITVATAAATLPRLGAPASPWWLACGVVLALGVPGWRRHPLRASPALLAALPWLPVPLPASALLWTGHLAWLAVALSVMAGLHDSLRLPRGLATARPSRLALAAGLLTTLAAVAVAWVLAPRLPGGDEPHYLIITQSLLKDGDLRIENNHADRDYAAYFAGTLAPDFIQRGHDGAIYSIHAPGVSVLVAPLFAAFGYRGAQATIVLLAGVTGALIWWIGWLATGDRGAAWFAWAAVAGSVTFLIQSVTIFPDGPGALIAALAAVVLLQFQTGRSPGGPTLLGLSAALAVLPFLHTRFVVLAAGFGLLVVLALLGEGGRRPGDRRRRVGLFLVVPAVAAAGWFTYFQLIYGTPNPTVPYGPNPETRLAYIPGGVLGLLFDEQFGLFTYTPVLAAAALGWVFVRRQDDVCPAGRLAFVVAAYLAAVGTYWMWWAGLPASPARFAAAVLPLLAAPVAAVWRRSGPQGRAIWRLLLLVSLAVAVVVLAVGRGALAWNVRDSRAVWLGWLAAGADVQRAWPSFFWRLTPGDVPSELTFAGHALAWCGTFVAMAAAALAWRRARPRGDEVLVAAWWLPLSLMLAAQIGWGVARADHLEPSDSQLRVLRRAAAGDALIQIQEAGIRRLRPAEAPVVIRVPRTDVGDGGPGSWAGLPALPAGEYTIRVRVQPPRGGRLALRIGRAVRPFRDIALARLSDQTVPASLPAGAAFLGVEADPTLASTGLSIDLRPDTLLPPVWPLAVASLSGNDITTFFLDRQVYVEDDGFWVRGQAAADLVIAAEGGRSAAAVELTNGPQPNVITLTDPAGRQTLRLSASESRRVDLSPRRTRPGARPDCFGVRIPSVGGRAQRRPPVSRGAGSGSGRTVIGGPAGSARPGRAGDGRRLSRRQYLTAAPNQIPWNRRSPRSFLITR